jgi:hypothetical protein
MRGHAFAYFTPTKIGVRLMRPLPEQINHPEHLTPSRVFHHPIQRGVCHALDDNTIQNAHAAGIVITVEAASKIRAPAYWAA